MTQATITAVPGIKNTTDVWNLTPPANRTLILQQHVIHQASK